MNDESLHIQSHNGAYTVQFRHLLAEAAADIPRDRALHVILDQRVANLHAPAMKSILEGAVSIQQVKALEDNKSLEVMPHLIKKLTDAGIRRDHLLLAIGGGIVQDMTCFIASILFRGIDWAFLPTTLLAQADSCIGSKSSINAVGIKNLVGNFYPPRQISIATEFLSTLDPGDLRSGVGEMLKVHAIDGPASFDRIAADYDKILSDHATLLGYVRRSLEIKQRYIEIDEFDRGPRQVFNFGHSFGHAIEAATDFAIPHGIAVTIGMDVALDVGQGLGKTDVATVNRMRPVLRRNALGYHNVPVPQPAFLSALSKDKKNTGSGSATVILPLREGSIERVVIPMDAAFKNIVSRYFENAHE